MSGRRWDNTITGHANGTLACADISDGLPFHLINTTRRISGLTPGAYAYHFFSDIYASILLSNEAPR